MGNFKYSVFSILFQEEEKMRKLLTILLMLVSLSLGATTYYVKNGGSDVAAGTSDATAWATLTKVNASSFSAGDSILFNRGDTFRGQLIVPSSGSDGSPIVIDAYGTGHKPQIFGSKTLNEDTDWEVHSGNVWKSTAVAGATSAYVSNYDIANLVFNNDAFCGHREDALVDVGVQGEWFFNTADSLIYIYSASNPGSYYTHIEVAGNYGETCIRIGNLKHHITIRNIDARYSGNWCIYADRAHDVIVEYCDVSWVGGWYAYSNVRQGNGIGAWFTTDRTYNIIIRYNHVSQCYDAGISPQASGISFNCSDIYIYGNIIENCHYSYETWTTSDDTLTNVGFYNNTCIAAGYSWSYDQRPDAGNDSDVMIWTTEGVHTNVFIKNNIFYGSRNKSLYIKEETVYTPLVLDNNLYDCDVVAITDAGTFTTLSAWQTESSQEASSVDGDVMFRTLGRYALKEGSPAIDAGIDVGLDYDYYGHKITGTPDIGAVEFGRYIMKTANKTYR